MAGQRTYTAEDALPITAFPLSDDVGYIVRVGDGDLDGVVLGSVFHADGRWRAYATTTAGGVPVLVASGDDLDELIVEHFLASMRLTDEP